VGCRVCGYRRRCRFSAPPGRPIGLGDDQADLVPGRAQRIQTGHRERRATEKDDPHATPRRFRTV
jgi:hypothetical protein